MNIERYLLGCPKCDVVLHYSSDFEQSLCISCGWIPGDPYKQKPAPVSLVEYLTLASMLYSQFKSNMISYDEYRHILMDEVYING